MELYSKWATASIQYRELTYAKALSAVEKELKEKEKYETFEISHPGTGKLIKKFIAPLSSKLNESKKVFYRVNTKSVVEINKIKINKDGEENYDGFSEIRPNRFITLIEDYVTPGVWLCEGPNKELKFKEKSIGSDLALTVLSSEMLHKSLPQIERIFTIPIPIMYENNLTFPTKGYDERFHSWLANDSPEISNLNMRIDEAKKVIEDIFKEFCFATPRDRDLAIAALLTPFLRGLFSSPTVRTPIFCYLANRERCGKDYCAGITGILYEGIALEESPISYGDGSKTTNNIDELRKKILSALIMGRKRLHFSNNRGHVDNPTLEAISTATKWSDRMLGRNEMLTFSNELDFSLSGNVGVSFTADLANRSRFINFFLDIEDANSRKFDRPDLQEWVKANRHLILSALYSLVRNWIELGKPIGSIPFTSFHEWSAICGGIMESAGYMNPCESENLDTVISSGINYETDEMRKLFEYCYSTHPDEKLSKKEIRELIRSEIDLDIFSRFNFDEQRDIIKFSMILTNFIGRVLSNIRLQIWDKNVRSARQELIFTKSTKIAQQTKYEQQKIGIPGTVGIPSGTHVYDQNNELLEGVARAVPTVPTVPGFVGIPGIHGTVEGHSSDPQHSKTQTLNSTGGT